MNKVSLPRAARIVLAALAASFVSAHAQPGAHVTPSSIPVLRVPEASIPVEIRRVHVEAQLVGLAAQTRIELEFFNPNGRVLEGELQFPLEASQTVTGFALDIDGELRAAVPVDKAKGRQVFEDVTRARVDPALLEATEGNNYKLRVYPLPARGSRRVVLEIAGSLARTRVGDTAGAAYVVPIAFGAPVRQLDVTVRVSGIESRREISASFGAQRLAIRRGNDGSALLNISRTGYRARDTLRVEVAPPTDAPQTAVHAFGDASYFYAEVPASTRTVPRPDPRTVAILWDASGSGSSRDHGREIVLLDAFFQAARNVQVELLVVRDGAEAPRRFAVAGGDWRALREHLRGLAYDGATRLDLMASPPGADLALLFSDGLSTYGNGGFPRSAVPLYAVSSSATANLVRLRNAAEESGGLLLDLTHVQPGDAARELRLQRTRVAAVEAVGATDVVLEGHYPRNGRLVVAGRLTEPTAQIALELHAADGTRSKRQVTVTNAAANAAQVTRLPLAAYRWATLKLAALEADRERHREAIRRLGVQFGLVTSGTSLIVLDTVADYARYEIEPPAPLRASYQELLAKRGRERDADRQAQIERVVRSFAQKQAWWEREFPKGDRPKPPQLTASAERDRADERASQRSAPAPSGVPLPAPAATARLMPPPAPPIASAPPPPTAPPGASASASTARARDAIQSAVALQKWVPDSRYAQRLRAANPDRMYAIYLDERPSYAASTAFFLDAADIFLERGQPALALRIMSNLAEMELENRHILRILAYRLQQAGQVQLALPILQKVLALSPDEPQSHRDLALAQAAIGQYQQAVDGLWQVISRPWHNRFPDVELVALAELNAIRARAEAMGQPPLDVSAIDARLLRNLPLDLRAVLTWDADNTDIDLHVVDPNGDEAYYGRQLTYQGGRMSDDFTGGYGPEEFSLRRAKPGTYTVRANFYGHRQQIVAPSTTLMLRLTTGFGTPQQKDHEVVLRLAGEGQQVTVGTFQVPGSTQPAVGQPSE